jgi:hypothetical protein
MGAARVTAARFDAVRFAAGFPFFADRFIARAIAASFAVPPLT